MFIPCLCRGFFLCAEIKEHFFVDKFLEAEIPICYKIEFIAINN